LRGDFVLDGEVCLLDENGKPNFEGVRSRTMGKSGALVTYFASIRDCTPLITLDGASLSTSTQWQTRSLDSRFIMRNSIRWQVMITQLNPFNPDEASIRSAGCFPHSPRADR
jgi:hypothetical protein